MASVALPGDGESETLLLGIQLSLVVAGDFDSEGEPGLKGESVSWWGMALDSRLSKPVYRCVDMLASESMEGTPSAR